MREVPYPTPGEILLHEFMEPMGLTKYRLAKEIGVAQGRIGSIITGKRAITADTGLRLSRFFETSEGFWSGFQLDYGSAQAKGLLTEVLDKIQQWSAKHAS